MNQALVCYPLHATLRQNEVIGKRHEKGWRETNSQAAKEFTQTASYAKQKVRVQY